MCSRSKTAKSWKTSSAATPPTSSDTAASATAGELGAKVGVVVALLSGMSSDGFAVTGDGAFVGAAAADEGGEGASGIGVIGTGSV